VLSRNIAITPWHGTKYNESEVTPTQSPDYYTASTLAPFISSIFGFKQANEDSPLDGLTKQRLKPRGEEPSDREDDADDNDKRSRPSSSTPLWT
jgi:hypothetical protein